MMVKANAEVKRFVGQTGRNMGRNARTHTLIDKVSDELSRWCATTAPSLFRFWRKSRIQVLQAYYLEAFGDRTPNM
jgi:hypothetical protein